MKIKYVLIAFLALLLCSCSKEKDELPTDMREGIGTVWLSGGLAFCAEQIRMDEGDTLIVLDWEKIYHFKSGDQVHVIYTETGQHESGCNFGIDCEIIEIVTID